MDQQAKGTITTTETDSIQNYINIWLAKKCQPEDLGMAEFLTNFENDRSWRNQWSERKSEFARVDDLNLFRSWSREQGKLADYPEEWVKIKEEWYHSEEAEEWRISWKATNFRLYASIRLELGYGEKGKFFGTLEEVRNKQFWESDWQW